MAAAGRPTLFTEDLADAIVDRISEGRSLRSICDDPDMPSRLTVMRWQDAKPEFEAKCARARVLQADFMDDKILDTADASTPETAAADRVKIAAYQWRASRLAPKKYGDKVALVGGTSEDEPIQVTGDRERAKAALALMRKAQG